MGIIQPRPACVCYSLGPATGRWLRVRELVLSTRDVNGAGEAFGLDLGVLRVRLQGGA